jgi:hypothetical protein
MLKIEDFFGIKLEQERSDITSFLSAIKVNDFINGTKVVKQIAAKNGSDSPIVGVARRQQFLKMIKPLVNEKMIDYDPVYFTKEVNTSSHHDRQYCAEDKLLQVALIIASTKSMKTLENESYILNVKQLRDASFLESRYDRLWSILAEETSHIIEAFRKRKK